MLAEKLDLRNHDVIQMAKKFELRNSGNYHYSCKIRLTSQVSKWSEATYQRLKEALDSGEYPRPTLT